MDNAGALHGGGAGRTFLFLFLASWRPAPMGQPHAPGAWARLAPMFAPGAADRAERRTGAPGPGSCTYGPERSEAERRAKGRRQAGCGPWQAHSPRPAALHARAGRPRRPRRSRGRSLAPEQGEGARCASPKGGRGARVQGALKRAGGKWRTIISMAMPANGPSRWACPASLLVVGFAVTAPMLVGATIDQRQRWIRL